VDNPNIGEVVHEMAFDHCEQIRCISRQSLAYSLQGIGRKNFRASKFILTLAAVRRVDQKRLSTHFNEKENADAGMDLWIARPKGNEDIYKSRDMSDIIARYWNTSRIAVNNCCSST